MILAAEFVCPKVPTAKELECLSDTDCRHVVLSPQAEIRLNRAAVDYGMWLHEVLAKTTEFFAIVRVPTHFLGTREVTNDVVTQYICHDVASQLRWRVFGVHLMAGLLSVQDYLLRVYSLLRSGFTYFLIVDDLSAYEGTYKDHAYDAAAAVWTQVTTREYVPVICRVTTLWQFLRCIASHKVQFVVVPYESLLRRKRWARVLSLFVN